MPSEAHRVGTRRSSGFGLPRRALLAGLSAHLASCFVPLEDDRWPMVYSGGFLLKTVNTAGWEELFADWSHSLFPNAVDRRTGIAGAACDGTELLLLRSRLMMATGDRVEGDNGLLRYSLKRSALTWIDFPLIDGRDFALSIPGIELAMVGRVAVPDLRRAPISELLSKAIRNANTLEWWVWSVSKRSWVLIEEGMDLPYAAEYQPIPPLISRLSATGRAREVVYCREGTIYCHDLGANERTTLGRGEFASVCLQAGLISWRTAEADIQIAEFPSLKPVRLLKGLFCDGVLWCPDGK